MNETIFSILLMILGLMTGFIISFLIEIYKLRRELKIRKKEMDEQQEIFQLEIESLKKKGKGKLG